jgi:hypothetical protein
MISQNCPKCQSQRIRRGYKPTGFFSKLIFRFNLLCDNCNWQFVGFALPFGSSKNKNYKRKKEERLALDSQTPQPAGGNSHLNSAANNPSRKKKVRVRF